MAKAPDEDLPLHLLETADVGQGVKPRGERSALELPFLNQIGEPGQRGDAKDAETEQRQRGVKFELPAEPGHGARHVDRCNECEEVDEEDNWRGERPEDRQAIGLPHDEVREHERPGKERERFEKIGDRTMADSRAALV